MRKTVILTGLLLACSRPATPPPVPALAPATRASSAPLAHAEAATTAVAGVVEPAAAPTSLAAPASYGSGHFAEFATLDEMGNLWRGNWLIQSSAGGPKQVWSVDGLRLQVADKEKTESRKFELQSPCSLQITTQGSSGGVAMIVPFGFDGDVAYVGLGASGLRRGNAALVCAGGYVFRFKDGQCHALSPDPAQPGQWQAVSANCAWLRQGGQEVFDVQLPGEPPGPHLQLSTVGSRGLMSEDMRAHPASRVGSLAEGRAKLSIP